MRPGLVGGIAIVSALFLGGCSFWPFGRTERTVEPAAPSPAERAAASSTVSPPLSAYAKQLLARRGLEEIRERPLNVRADCTFRDETGYGGRLDLDVRDAGVQRFAATVDIPGHGQCRFNLTDFHQTTRLPHVTLAGAAGGCTVRMWEQGTQVTVAFNTCQAQCNAGTFDYLWPILVKGGRCF